MALDVGDPGRRFTFRQQADGAGEGVGPSGQRHERFRTWKEDLQRDGAGGEALASEATPPV
jgi:hypothetical protein